MNATIEQFRDDEDLIDTLGEVYAGDDRTYADELAELDSWQSAWAMLVRACATARISGDYVAAESIRDAVGRYHVELESGRTAELYARRIAGIVAGATR